MIFAMIIMMNDDVHNIRCTCLHWLVSKWKGKWHVLYCTVQVREQYWVHCTSTVQSVSLVHYILLGSILFGGGGLSPPGPNDAPPLRNSMPCVESDWPVATGFWRELSPLACFCSPASTASFACVDASTTRPRRPCRPRRRGFAEPEGWAAEATAFDTGCASGASCSECGTGAFGASTQGRSQTIGTGGGGAKWGKTK